MNDDFFVADNNSSYSSPFHLVENSGFGQFPQYHHSGEIFESPLLLEGEKADDGKKSYTQRRRRTDTTTTTMMTTTTHTTTMNTTSKMLNSGIVGRSGGPSFSQNREIKPPTVENMKSIRPGFLEKFRKKKGDDRKWETLDEVVDGFSSKIFLNGRREKRSEKMEVDEKLFMSIRYDLTHNVVFNPPQRSSPNVGSCEGGSSNLMMGRRKKKKIDGGNGSGNGSFIISKVELFFADNFSLANSEGKLFQVEETPMRREAGIQFNGISKIRFLDSSYHHNRRAFVLIVSYINANSGDVMGSFVSPQFRIYARKPQKRKKRNRDDAGLATSEFEKGKKKRKLSNIKDNKSFADTFNAGWLKVEKDLKNMPREEKERAFRLILEKLFPVLQN